MQNEKKRVLISARSYSTEAHSLLKKITQLLAKDLNILRISSVYKVKAEGHREAHIHDLRSVRVFEGLCVAIKAETELSPLQLLNLLENIEKECSNQSMRRSASLNLLLCEEMTIMTPKITLPHPEFHRRPEDLIPAAEVWGDYRHPILKENIFSLTKSLGNKGWGEFYAQGKSLLDF